MMNPAIEHLATQIGHALKKRQWKLSAAESCTGGGLSYALTMISGSSEWFDRGFVTYSNLSKEELLGVHKLTINTFGAVSEQCALEMAEGALQRSQADVSISITGIAGPTGGTAEKPVGTVWFAWTDKDRKPQSYVDIFRGDRAEIREQSIETALTKLLDFIAK